MSKNKRDAGIESITQQIAESLAQVKPNALPGMLVERCLEQLPRAADPTDSRQQVIKQLAQTLVHARLVWQSSHGALHEIASSRDLFPPDSELLGYILRRTVKWSSPDSEIEDDWRTIAELLEQLDLLFHDESSDASSALVRADYEFDVWVSRRDKETCKRFGVFYTPPSLARYIVHEIHTSLQSEFGLVDGLADTTTWREITGRCSLNSDFNELDQPFVGILDPALGGGVFLVEVIQCVWDALREKWRLNGLPDDQIAAAWNEYVAGSLLPRVVGLEILLPAAAVAWLRIAEKLAQTGYDFSRSSAINVLVTDSLNGEPIGAGLANQRRPIAPFTVVLGNPPFSALTASTNAWIEKVMRQGQLAGRTVGSFYEVDGAPLGERKLWLHDEYVKFIRLGQWQIEQAGCGIVGFVTNHGFLDNVTFRGMRQSLLNSFPSVSFVDLHGNRKKCETAPNDEANENVFGIDQGVAVGIFRKPPKVDRSEIRFREVWGTRDAKLNALDGTEALPEAVQIAPTSPYYFFVPQASGGSVQIQYEAGFRLSDVMRVQSSAAVTARDSFVVSFTRQELEERLAAFRDESISDEAIRQRFFQNTRSQRYEVGDTRGWKLPEARKRFRAERNADVIRPCQYRPFDRRFIAWSSTLIDWPRTDAMRHMIEYDNLAIVTRRQMVAGKPCNFFFITDTIVVDGIIRSDNRGNESFFPLYVSSEILGNKQLHHNFTDEFLDDCQRRMGLRCLEQGDGNLEATIGPEDLFAMIYAQFYSDAYRQRFSSQLRVDFPRFFLPESRELLTELCRLGRELIQVQRLRFDQLEPIGGEFASPSVVIDGQFPCYQSGKLYLAEACVLENVRADVWEYCVGTHQVCRKWLRDRRGRQLTGQELADFRKLLFAVERTIDVSCQIDEAIEESGGWTRAFG